MAPAKMHRSANSRKRATEYWLFHTILTGFVSYYRPDSINLPSQILCDCTNWSYTPHTYRI